MKQQRKSYQRNAHGFTLVEMLVVMTIALILMAITIGSIRGTNSTANRHAAVGALMGVFDRARAIAISEGLPTYVVFASNPKSQSLNASISKALPDTTWGRGYAIYQDRELKDSDTAATSITIQRSNWMRLPVGVAFKADGNDGTPASVTATVLDNKTFSVVSRNGPGAGAVELALPYVKFDSAGMIVNNASGDMVDAAIQPWSACLRILLFEGIASSAGDETLTRRAAVTGAEGKKYALDEIMLKPTTGRARYTLDPINNLAMTATSTHP